MSVREQPQTRSRVPIDLTPENVPAVVQEIGPKVAIVTHPAGDNHPNALATRRRLRLRGFRIVKVESEGPTSGRAQAGR